MDENLAGLLDELSQLVRGTMHTASANVVIAHEATALAAALGPDRADLIARRMRELHRRQTVKALEVQGKAAALIEAYRHSPGSDQ